MKHYALLFAPDISQSSLPDNSQGIHNKTGYLLRNPIIRGNQKLSIVAFYNEKSFVIENVSTQPGVKGGQCPMEIISSINPSLIIE